MEVRLAYYEAKIQTARTRAGGRFQAVRMVDGETAAFFWINFCALGVPMTESVPDWIRRAGQRTEELGFAELGKSLIRHADHEMGHHQLFINDVKALISWWNSHRSPKLEAQVFLDRLPTPGVKAYRKLHEDCIRGRAPYGQIAIEYEIERLSVEEGPLVIAWATQLLGPNFLKCLSFIQEHIAVDAGHTQFNGRVLDEFLVANGERVLGPLIEFGSGALDCYAAYVEDCLSLARMDRAKM